MAAGAQHFALADGGAGLDPWLEAQISRAIEPLAKRLKTVEDENARLTRVVVAMKTMVTNMNHTHLHEYEVLDARIDTCNETMEARRQILETL